MVNVAFRVEGGKKIGMGHIMRCLSLAKEFERQKCKVIFISKMSEARDFAEASRIEQPDISELAGITNLPVKEMSADAMEAEGSCLKNVIIKHNINILVLDSYNISYDYMNMLNKLNCKLVYIDDLNSFRYQTNMVINGNITAKYMNYPQITGQKLLLGTEFNLIRDEFKGIPHKVINSTVRNILLTTGGSDPYNTTQKILEYILNYTVINDITIHVVIGKAFIYEDNLNKLALKHKNIVLHKNVSEMSKLMNECDLAISAGGSTLYELCACGVPTFAFILADNQEFLVQKMDELGYIKSLGWYDKMDVVSLLETIRRLCSETSLREEISRKMQGLVDGLGTSRVVKSILSL